RRDTVDDADGRERFDVLDVAAVDKELHDSPYSFLTGFVSSPMPATFTVTVSPCFTGPTPDGVPLEMMSPGSSVMTNEMNSINPSSPQISCDVSEACRLTPLTQVSTPRASGPAPTATAGPIGANVSNPFARVYCTSFVCRSRAV